MPVSWLVLLEDKTRVTEEEAVINNNICLIVILIEIREYQRLNVIVFYLLYKMCWKNWGRFSDWRGIQYRLNQDAHVTSKQA